MASWQKKLFCHDVMAKVFRNFCTFFCAMTSWPIFFEIFVKRWFVGRCPQPQFLEAPTLQHQFVFFYFFKLFLIFLDIQNNFWTSKKSFKAFFKNFFEKHFLDIQTLKKNFTTVKHFKPDASRKESPENYVIAQGYKG